MGLSLALSALKTAVVAAINAAGFGEPAQAGIGWPVATDLVAILKQSDGEYVVSLYPLPGAKRSTRYGPDDSAVTTAVSTGLSVTIAANVATFAGTATSTANVHGFLLSHSVDAYVQIASGASSAVAASAFGAAINGLALPGISATVAGSAVTVVGAVFDEINIGGSGTISSEAGRVTASVQVSIWTSADATTGVPLCMPIGDALIAAVGQMRSRSFPVSDGSYITVDYRTDTQSDAAQATYSVYVRHIIFDVEYVLLQTVAATQVGGFTMSAQTARQPAVTTSFGGPT